MGSKLHVLAPVVILGLASSALANPPADLEARATEAYKAGRYDEAAALLKQLYDVSAKPETLFALAQAERLGGHCDAAIPHYKKLLEELSDFNVAKLVQSNLTLCQKDEPVKPPPDNTKPAPPPPQPTAPPKVIVRDSGHTDALAVTLIAGGTLALGASVGLFVAANGSRDDAADAKTIEDSRRIQDRADFQRNLGIAAGVAGVGLASYAIVRWIRGGKESRSGVAVIPGANSIGVFARW